MSSVLVVTGAGISAESGVPTFRGPEGYWTTGSTHYRPMELATFDAFRSRPETVWGWYLYRRAICRRAEPNAAHGALVELDRALGDRMLLVTQNVDGLHARAGHAIERLYAIHGSIELARCAEECGRGPATVTIPESLGQNVEKGYVLDRPSSELLRCPACGAWLRPHVLWFDETYDEDRYRYESSMRAAMTCSMLIVIGTSGSTTLPVRIAEVGARRRIPMIVIDPAESIFSELARATNGEVIAGTAVTHVPRIAREIADRFAER